MAYPILDQSIMAVTLLGIHEGQHVQNTLHYQVQTPTTLPNGQATLDALFLELNADDRLIASWRACLSVKVSTLRCRMQWIREVRFAVNEKILVPGDGAEAGSSYPVNTAVAITRRTEIAGRSQVGTIHMPGVPINGITNGLVGVAMKELYTNFANESIQPVTVLGGPTFVPVLLNRTEPGAEQPLTSFTVKNEARIMRRRTVGLGI